MAKTPAVSPKEKIIKSLPSLDDDSLKEISHATASELGRREKELEGEINSKKERLEAIRGGNK